MVLASRWSFSSFLLVFTSIELSSFSSPIEEENPTDLHQFCSSHKASLRITIASIAKNRHPPVIGHSLFPHILL
ncbi:unnamed protein product [Victoria cruziana]